jgi:hypothetical protein
MACCAFPEINLDILFRFNNDVFRERLTGHAAVSLHAHLMSLAASGKAAPTELLPFAHVVPRVPSIL